MFLDSEASVLCQRNRFREAEKDWLRALTIGEKAYGDDVQQYSAILTHLGELYSGLGDYESAAGLLKRSLAAYEQPGNRASISHAIIMSELANVYTKSKRYSQAEPLFSRSIEIVNRDQNLAPLGKALVLTRAGDYYMARHDWVAPEQQYRRALTLREAALGDHPLVAASLTSLSQALRKLARKKEAKDGLARADQTMAVQNEPLYSGETVDARQFSAK
jgi:tetratricopeptide (TPR) repeat protein